MLQSGSSRFRRRFALALAALVVPAGLYAVRATTSHDTPLVTSSSNLDSLSAAALRLNAELEGISDSMSRVVRTYSDMPLEMPTDGWLSSRYANSRLHPVRNRMQPHRGIDVAAPMGTPVIATAAGTVVRVARDGGYGLLVEIDHGAGVLTRYAHLSQAFVKVNERVLRGMPIAAVGNSGLSTGPHLHYEIVVNGRAVDPLAFMGN